MSDHKPLNIEKDGLTPEKAEFLLGIAKQANQTLWQLESLFKKAKADTEENHKHTDCHHLISLGSHHAMDQANIIDCMIESLERGEDV